MGHGLTIRFRESGHQNCNVWYFLHISGHIIEGCIGFAAALNARLSLEAFFLGGFSGHGTSWYVTVMNHCYPETNFLVTGWAELVDV